MTTTYDPTKDSYANQGRGPGTFGNGSTAVVTSDTVDFGSYPKAIVVTAAGNLVVLPLKAPDDGAHLITFTGVSPLQILPIRVRRVMATGTTASCATIDD